MSKYSELAQRRADQTKRRQKRQLLNALRNGKYDKSTTTHTVHYKGEPITITEVEYLWLYVRGHLKDYYQHTSVESNPYLTLKEPS